MKKLIAVTAVLCSTLAFAGAPAPTGTALGTSRGKVEVSTKARAAKPTRSNADSTPENDKSLADTSAPSKAAPGTTAK